jgi:hypothetical protein
VAVTSISSFIVFYGKALLARNTVKPTGVADDPLEMTLNVNLPAQGKYLSVSPVRHIDLTGSTHTGNLDVAGARQGLGKSV